MEKALLYVLLFFGALFSVYSLYWGGILVTGGYVLRKENNVENPSNLSYENLPKISVLIPVRNEAKLIGRLLNALNKVNYPEEKLEIIFVEDGSTDGTYELLLKCKERDRRIKVIHLEENNKGKPKALNEGLKHATGELIALLDADCIPEPDIFLKAANEYRRGKKILVGYFKVVNKKESLIAKLAVFEEISWRLMGLGRMKLGLNVPISGSFSFIDRKLLLKAKGWNACLAEDVELGARLLKMGYKGHFLNGFVWLEVPGKIPILLKQRIRWYRGYMETAIKHIDLLWKVKKKLALDFLLLLTTPFFAALTLFSYALYALSFHFLTGLLLILFIAGFIGANLLGLIALNVGLMLIAGSEAYELMRISPLVYLYTLILAISSLIACLQMILKKKPVWVKTEKSGWIDSDRVILSKLLR